MKSIFGFVFFVLFSINVSAESLNPYATLDIKFPAGSTTAIITTDAVVDLCNSHALDINTYVGGPGPLNSDMGLYLISTKMACLTPAQKLETLSLEINNDGGDFVLSYETYIFTNVKVEYK